MYIGYHSTCRGFIWEAQKECFLTGGEGSKACCVKGTAGFSARSYTRTDLCCVAGVLCFCKMLTFVVLYRCTLIPAGRSHFLQWARAQRTLYCCTAVHSTTKCNKNPPDSTATVLQVIAAVSPIISARPVLSTTASGDFFHWKNYLKESVLFAKSKFSTGKCTFLPFSSLSAFRCFPHRHCHIRNFQLLFS